MRIRGRMRCMYAAMFGLIVIISTGHQAQGQTATEGPKIVPALPTPSGTMPIGRRRYEWLDPSRKSSTGGSRVVVVSIFSLLQTALAPLENMSREQKNCREMKRPNS
jgi:hypothetical protein